MLQLLQLSEGIQTRFPKNDRHDHAPPHMEKLVTIYIY